MVLSLRTTCRVLTTIMANTCIQIVWMWCSVLQKGWRCHTETHEREGHFVIQLHTLTFMEYESETWGMTNTQLLCFALMVFGDHADDQNTSEMLPHMPSSVC